MSGTEQPGQYTQAVKAGLIAQVQDFVQAWRGITDPAEWFEFPA